MKRKIANWALKYLWNAVIEDDILAVRGNRLVRGNKVVPKDEAISLVTGAQSLRHMEIWNQLQIEMKMVANRRMYDKGQVPDDILFGKAMLYTLDIMQKKVDSLAKIKVN